MNIDSLIDSPLIPGTLDNLVEPLIPPPVDTYNLDDIYIVGETSSGRWRTFINCLDWNPKKYNNHLLQRRAFHSRACWEAIYLLSFTDSSWVSIGAFTMIKDTAHLELRKVEIELLSFQLTTGVVGIKMDHQRNVYDASVVFFVTVIWFADLCLKQQELSLKSKSEKKDIRKEHAKFMHMKPFPHHGIKELAKNLDQLIHALHMFLSAIQLTKQLPIAEIGKKLQSCILMIDKIIIVTK